MDRRRNLAKELGLDSTGEGGPVAADPARIGAMVRDQLASATMERMEEPMKISGRKLRTLLIAAAAAVVLSLSALAASSGMIVSWFSSSRSRGEYQALPAAEQVIRDVGYDVRRLERFSNGYVFQEGSVVNNDLLDDNGQSVEAFRSVDFRYARDGDIVYFAQERYTSEMGKAPGEVLRTVDGIDLVYHSYRNQLVPADYVLSEAERAAEEAGELVFSYGSEAVELHTVQSVIWEADGMHYCLMQIDGALRAEDLADMAAEVITQSGA